MTNIEKVQRDLELLKETGELKPTPEQEGLYINLLRSVLFLGNDIYSLSWLQGVISEEVDKVNKYNAKQLKDFNWDGFLKKENENIM